ncbi:MAG: D-aminoacyl-tRNA deacylase [Bacillota bacterium]|nr:D-aminoacyl-tRNA deacylase [Bacillota bacterium]
MRAVVQVAKRASVTVDGKVVARIQRGLLVLLGVAQEDTAEDALWMAEKLAHLRVLPDEEGRMNRSLLDTGGEALVVSQFTLLGDAQKGRRPSFTRAAAPERALALYEEVMNHMGSLGIAVQKGVFGAHMEVEVINDGPVTILLESPQRGE